MEVTASLSAPLSPSDMTRPKTGQTSEKSGGLRVGPYHRGEEKTGSFAFLLASQPACLPAAAFLGLDTRQYRGSPRGNARGNRFHTRKRTEVSQGTTESWSAVKKWPN